jgi:hypothetical protein
MKGKKLSFPFISFSESGLFNGLREKNKKNVTAQVGESELSHWAEIV